MAEQSKIDAFWRWFAQNEANLQAITEEHSTLIQQLGHQLREIDAGLTFEISQGLTINEFIVSARGDTGLFAVVERVVQSAPTLDSWRFTALKPPRSGRFVSEFEGLQLASDELYCLPFSHRTIDDFFGLKVKIPPQSDPEDRRCQMVVKLILEGILGERIFYSGLDAIVLVSHLETSMPLHEFANRTLAAWNAAGARRRANEKL